jgi:hypothetical protein
VLGRYLAGPASPPRAMFSSTQNRTPVDHNYPSQSRSPSASLFYTSLRVAPFLGPIIALLFPFFSPAPPRCAPSPLLTRPQPKQKSHDPRTHWATHLRTVEQPFCAPRMPYTARAWPTADTEKIMHTATCVERNRHLSQLQHSVGRRPVRS